MQKFPEILEKVGQTNIWDTYVHKHMHTLDKLGALSVGFCYFADSHRCPDLWELWRMALLSGNQTAMRTIYSEDASCLLRAVSLRRHVRCLQVQELTDKQTDRQTMRERQTVGKWVDPEVPKPLRAQGSSSRKTRPGIWRPICPTTIRLDRR